MKNPILTEKQQSWLDHIHAAKAQGVSLATYARDNNIKLHSLYSGIGVLRQKGVLTDAPSESNFVRVLVDESRE